MSDTTRKAIFEQAAPCQLGAVGAPRTGAPIVTVLALALVVAATLSVPTAAHAADPPRRWYGWQLLPGDIGGLTLAVVGTQLKKTRWPLWTGIAAVTLGAPIVHWAHGHVGKGFGSFGMRLGGLAVSGVLAWMMLAKGGFSGGLGGTLARGALAFLIVAIGVLTPMIIDNAVVAREDAPVGASASPLRARAGSLSVPLRFGWASRF